MVCSSRVGVYCWGLGEADMVYSPKKGNYSGQYGVGRRGSEVERPLDIYPPRGRKDLTAKIEGISI